MNDELLRRLFLVAASQEGGTPASIWPKRITAKPFRSGAVKHGFRSTVNPSWTTGRYARVLTYVITDKGRGILAELVTKQIPIGRAASEHEQNSEAE